MGRLKKLRRYNVKTIDIEKMNGWVGDGETIHEKKIDFRIIGKNIEVKVEKLIDGRNHS